MWTLEIPGWFPVPLNRLLSSHWAVARRLKAKDKDTLGMALLAYRVPPATGKRRVRLTVIWGKGKRACDKDALTKSLWDGLVHHGALKNDSHLWVEMPEPVYAKGEYTVTYVTLEDV